MKMREAFEELARMAKPNEAYAADYHLTSFGGLPCSLYLASRKDIYYGNNWDEAVEKLKGTWKQPPPDEEGEERGCRANLEARG